VSGSREFANAQSQVPLRVDATVAVALGGFAGVSLRLGVGLLWPNAHGNFAWTTLWINLVGSFALGALLELVHRRGGHGWKRYARLGLGTGLLGGFTTYSTVSVQSAQLVRGHHDVLAATYLVVSVLTCVGAAYSGILAASLITRDDIASLPIDPDVDPGVGS
jgi:fluoride exporter